MRATRALTYAALVSALMYAEESQSHLVRRFSASREKCKSVKTARALLVTYD